MPVRRNPLLALTSLGTMALLVVGCSSPAPDADAGGVAAPESASSNADAAQADTADTDTDAGDAAQGDPVQAETAAALAATAISPAELPVSGGARVTIEGTGLADATVVTFNGVPGTELAVESDERVTVVSPRSPNFQPAAADIQVVTDGASAPVAAPASYTVQTPVDRQMRYALAHWNNYNLAAYGDMNPIGGDCVNFVSQTLIERGWEMTEEWHNRSGGAEWTSAWIHVPTFDRWLRANADTLGITPLSIEQRDQVKVGDIVVFDWNLNDSLDHTQIVSAVEVVDGKQRILMVGHNLDHDFRDFDNTITVEHPNAYAAFWSVP
ncbi:amidase domain-containing protein [Planctomonas psychrotolerans]|uniref:amidase domain-containing protein n=1 Tax=Planctomonas psychrotolerans TaxID=2528712 RepID=UPI001D0D2C0E|nr:amidase domain-containing protein [Planctomonas psychrotolerans]